MASVTIQCHGAELYYFLCHNFMSKPTENDLQLDHITITKSTENEIATHLVKKMVVRKGVGYVIDVTFHSHDEELLCWLVLAIPKEFAIPKKD